MATMSKYGKGKGNSKVLELVCKGECKKHYEFVQQVVWPHHFLPLCGCKDNKYFQIPNYIPKEQYEKYMLSVTTEKNKVIFTID